MTVKERTATPAEALPPAPATTFDLLEGVRVVDFTSSIAGPYAGMLLGDFGADVVKIEAPSGDDCRTWGPPFCDGESLWYLAVNRNKRSVVLDTAAEDDAKRLRALIASADVFLCNQTPAVARKAGLDYDSVRALRSDIVYVSITGFGLDGARADMACYDLIAEGYSGIMDLTGPRDADPQKVGAPAADMLAGHDAAMAAIAALYRRRKSGQGALVDIALVESMARFTSCRMVPYLGSGEVPRRSGGTDSVIAIYQTFHTADKPLTLAIGNNGQWKRFWSCVGEPAVGEEPAYATNAMRRAKRAEIVECIQALLRARPRDEWLRQFERMRVPCGPINGVDEVTADVELQARGLFYRVDRGGSAIPQVGTGIRLDGQANGVRRPPPALGTDTAEVLREWLGE